MYDQTGRLIRRQRIEKLFERRPVVQLIAPSGFGKTTVALQWAVAQPRMQLLYAGETAPELTERSRTTPLSLPFGDDIVAAYNVPLISPTTPANEGPTSALGTIVLLDDLDHLSESARATLLTRAEAWVSEDPAHHNLIVASRQPFSATGRTPRQAFRRRMIGAADLTFTLDEVAELVATWPRSRSGEPLVADIMALTGGWPVAIAAAEDGAMAQELDEAWLPLDLSLRDKVLAALPNHLRTPLQACWPLDEVDAGVWQAVCGAMDVTGDFAQLSIAAPLMHQVGSDGRRCFRLPNVVRQRFHHLAPDVPDRDTSEQMLRYWLDEDRFDQAAIVAERLDDWDLVLEVVRGRCLPLAQRDLHDRIIALLEPFPMDVIAADPDLGYWLAMSLLSETRYSAGQDLLRLIESRSADGTSPLDSGRLSILRSLASIFGGDAGAAQEFAEQACRQLPEDAWQERFRALATTEVLARHAGNSVAADRAIDDLVVVRDRLPADQRWWYMFVVPNRAEWLLKAGRLHDAESFLEHQLRSTSGRDASVIRIRLAQIALEQCDPDRAAHWLNMEEEVRQSYWWLEAALTGVQLLRAQGRDDEAAEELYAIIADRMRHNSPVEILRPQILLASIWIEQEQLELAETWLALASRSLDGWPRSFGFPIPGVVRASLAMARNRWSEAIDLLAPLVGEGRRREQGGLLVQVLAHVAVAQAELGQSEQARRAVQEAVDVTRGGLYLQSFHVGDVNTRDFLVRDPVQVVRVRRRPGQPLMVLSDREIEVLQLTNAGLTNAGIADRLFVSKYTVKNHLAHIYARLGASNRREAVQIAQRMGLLVEASESR